jgi:hypothetical protein
MLLRLSHVRLFLHVIIQKGGSGLSAVVTIMVLRHEASNSGNRTVFSQTGYLAIRLNPVVLESLQGDGLIHTLGLLGLGVDLLFALLTSSTEPQDQVKSRFLLDIVITQSAAIFQLLSGKDQTLLIRRDSFLVLDLGLDIIDSVRGLDI